MASLISSLVHETSTTTGTGNFTIAAIIARRRFTTAFGTGGSNTFYYAILHRTIDEWEYGSGHLSSSSVLVRDTVIASSNANALVNFTAGDKDVLNDLPAEYQIRNLGTQLDFSLADAGANAFLGWDDTAGRYENLTAAEAEAIIEPLIDTLDNLTSIQTRTVTLADAGADVLFAWDDSGSAYKNMALADITTSTTPASGDFMLIYTAAGALAKADFVNFPIASDTFEGVAFTATVATMETGTDVASIVTPGRLHRHSAAAKGWAHFNSSGTILGTSYNVTSVTDNGVGDWGVNWNTDFSGNAYAAVAYGGYGTGTFCCYNIIGQVAATATVHSFDNTVAAQDPDQVNLISIVAFGDHA